jgi:hypothetical protein
MRDLEQALQVLRLFFVQIDKLHTETATVPMVPHFPLQIKPIVTRQQHAERNDLSHHHLAHSVEIAASFGKIRDARGMAFFATIPNCVEVHAQPGSRSSFIHGPKPY